MEYTRESREKLYQDHLASWRKRLFLASGSTKRLAEEVSDLVLYNSSHSVVDDIRRHYQQANEVSLSVFFKKYYKGLVQAFVDKKDVDDYYAILDKLNQFPYAEGMFRRTVRSKHYGPFVETALKMLRDYRSLQFYGGSLVKYLRNDMPEDRLDMKGCGLYYFRFWYLDNLLAARIDAGDRELVELIREMILSDNNTALITVEVIRGIVKSSNRELHRLLADFLVAARLQEGVRQAICENADCGVHECFMTLFDTICDKGLLRFAAVKRALATWTGIGGYEHGDRINEKILADMRAGVDDVGKALEYTRSNDSIHITVGLWVLGMRNVEDAIHVMSGYLETGTRNQILTMSYYNRSLDYGRFSAMTAKKVVERFAPAQEWDYIAAFMPSYMNGMDYCLQKALTYGKMKGGLQEEIYHPIPVTDLFADRQEAVRHFGLLKQLYEAMPKKKMEIFPCIFPWYGVSFTKGDLVKRMCCIAYMLQEESYMLYAAGQLDQMENGYSERARCLKLLLHEPASREARNLVLQYVTGKETYSRTAACRIAEDISIDEEQYRMLEEGLRFKNSDIRSGVLRLLERQEGPALENSVKRLLASDKEETRQGGLSLAMAMQKKGELSTAVKDAVRGLKNPSEKEQVLIRELTGESVSQEILNTRGYGLYDPDVETRFDVGACDRAFLKEFFSRASVGKIAGIIEKLRKLLEDNAEREYKTAGGGTELLGNCFWVITHDDKIPIEDRYPFKELWVSFYEEEIGDPDLLGLLILAVQPRNGYYCPAEMAEVERQLLGGLADYNRQKYRSYKGGKSYSTDYFLTIFSILQSIYGAGSFRRAGIETIKYILTEVPGNRRWFVRNVAATSFSPARQEDVSLTQAPQLSRLISEVRPWRDDGEFQERFKLFFELDRVFDFWGYGRKQKERDAGAYYGAYYGKTTGYLGVFDYVKAYGLGLITVDAVYKAMFEEIGPTDCLRVLGQLYQNKMTYHRRMELKFYFTEEQLEQDVLDVNIPLYRDADMFCQNAISCILDVELARGEQPTLFSESVVKIEKFFGMNRLVQILVVFGKDKLSRGQNLWHYGYGGRREVSRQESFSHLIRVCYPLPGDNARRLEELLAGKKISRQRLIEVAMYAPQWMDIFEEYLGYPGFKLGCYYFMAHMNDYFDDRRKAVIAKYTPLTVEELNDGAFDVNWFFEAYEKLGDEVFQKLYEAAKYISDGSKHARARKYADAALGRVTAEQLEAEIGDKRNKDLLMSYGLVPFEGKRELVRRYEFIKKFEKESKQFGAQRRASESAAARMALRNLATRAGYADITRLTLAMETELVKTYAPYFAWQPVGEVQVKLAVDDLGSAEILCEKGGRALKSIPAALKKEELVVGIKEVHKKLKEQYSRTVRMFENAMETGEEFYYEELTSLQENPVTAAVVRRLVFVTEKGELGFLQCGEKLAEGTAAGGLRDLDGSIISLAADARLRAAHAFDLYKSGEWNRYQAYFYQKAGEGIMYRQPFKQVFRELYVKLPEELNLQHSLLFAGNQIQPAKTAACLKSRRWVADYENGLQKIYYKDNIIARIYALADWFSPSDVEAPTLEWVEFSDRKTFQSIAIKDVPDVIYSEVMRDVDLAVSIAHAGGVDPETSHSTIEMRRVIVAFNLPLFGLSNVELKDSHAIVQGKLGRYSIHLGSGVIHQLGGHQINVLPVHSQSRGKLFLPFVDEDPKTAEIMSKIVLFARDEKIKDPYILDQITK